MTPKAKTEKSTTLIIERRVITEDSAEKNDVHVAGGAHKGIVINKTLNSGL